MVVMGLLIWFYFRGKVPIYLQIDQILEYIELFSLKNFWLWVGVLKFRNYKKIYLDIINVKNKMLLISFTLVNNNK